MQTRSKIVRAILPLLALGAIGLGVNSAGAAEAGYQVAAASGRYRSGPAKAAAPALKRPDAAPARKGLADDGTWAQVSGANVNLRSGPGTQCAIITTLKSGEYLKPVAAVGTWLEVEWPETVSLWIAKNALLAKDGNQAVLKMDSSLRLQPARKAQAVSTLSKGAAVTILGENAEWCRVLPPKNTHAYITSKYTLTGVQRPVLTPSPKAASVIAAVPGRGENAETAEKKDAAAAAAAAPAKPLAAQIEETRRSLQEVAPVDPAQKAAYLAANSSSGTDEIARLLKDVKRADEEQARVAESKRREAEETARIETAARLRAEQEEQARVAESKRREAEETARIETAARLRTEQEEQARVAESKRREAEEAARIETAARLHAEQEEQARVAESKRREAEEAARIETAARLRTEQEEQARVAESKRREAEEAARIETAARNRSGSFIAPELASVEAEAPRAKAHLPEPAQPAGKVEAAAVVRPTAAGSIPAVVVIRPESQSAALAGYTPEAARKVGRKFVMPSFEPVQPGARAEIIAISEQELPTPAGAAPASQRIQPTKPAVAWNTDTGNAITADGTLEPATLSTVSGPAYALVRDGITVYLLTARKGIDMESYLGRRVTVAGRSLQSTSASSTILEVGSVSSAE